MHITAHLGVDVVAVETTDQVDVLLELAAPQLATVGTAKRPAATVQIVLDRSGSMSGERIEAAKTALMSLVDRLDTRDNFGVVIFDDVAEVAVPAGPVKDRDAVKRQIAAIGAGGSTNLSSGYFRGLREVRRVCGPAGAVLILLSDGMANAGQTEPHELSGVAARAAQQSITTVTVGIGHGYDDRLLQAMAAGGAGDHVFAGSADEAGPVVAAQVTGLLSKTAQAVSLLVRVDPAVQGMAVLNDLPGVRVDDGVMLELGDLWAGECRKLVLRFHVPAMAGLGLARIADVELRYIRLPDLVEETVILPVSVNVVPADVAAGRVPDPEVRSEALLLEAQRAKKAAAEALRHGDTSAASELFDAAAQILLDSHVEGDDVEAETRLLRDLAARAAGRDDVQGLTRFTTSDTHSKSNRRGRTTT